VCVHADVLLRVSCNLTRADRATRIRVRCRLPPFQHVLYVCKGVSRPILFNMHVSFVVCLIVAALVVPTTCALKCISKQVCVHALMIVEHTPYQMTVAGTDVQHASNGTCDAQKWCIKITAVNEKGWNNASRRGVCVRVLCRGDGGGGQVRRGERDKHLRQCGDKQMLELCRHGCVGVCACVHGGAFP
jgi:hypothetical protein